MRRHVRRQVDVVFRQRFCGADDCGAVFYICCCCDRGQRYCSDGCRQTARRWQRREANHKHQQTSDGKADHCDRQQDYRKRRAQARVTDQSSPCPWSSAKIAPAIPVQAPEPIQAIWNGFDTSIRFVVCIICRRRGLWRPDPDARRTPS